MGHSSSDIRERFQWTFPIVFSRTGAGVLPETMPAGTLSRLSCRALFAAAASAAFQRTLMPLRWPATGSSKHPFAGQGFLPVFFVTGMIAARTTAQGA